MLTFGSLFAGIGGIDLGLERAGMTCKWQVEIDPFCQQVLAKHWPDVPRFGDIKELTGEELEHVDVIAGGFPCQPVSLAGKGKAQADERWLWPEFERLVRLVRPLYVVVENVPGLCQRGLSDVLGTLADIGFDAEWTCLSAASMGAPHLRDRLFVVAYSQRLQLRQQRGWSERENRESEALTSVDGSAQSVADPNSQGQLQQSGPVFSEWGRTSDSSQQTHVADTSFFSEREPSIETEPESRSWYSRQIFGSGSKPGLAGHWAVEPDVGRVAHGVPQRVDRLKTLGNAVVPQVAEFVGRRLVGVAA